MSVLFRDFSSFFNIGSWLQQVKFPFLQPRNYGEYKLHLLTEITQNSAIVTSVNQLPFAYQGKLFVSLFAGFTDPVFRVGFA